MSPRRPIDSRRSRPGPAPSADAGPGPGGGLRPHERRALGFLLVHALAGVGGAIAFAACLIGFDVGGLRGLIFEGADGPLALALLVGGLSVTFGGVAMAVGVMALAEDRP